MHTSVKRAGRNAAIGNAKPKSKSHPLARRRRLPLAAKLQPTDSPPSVRAMRAWVTDRTVWIKLEDGRQVGFPADQFPALADATAAQLAAVELRVRGTALRWEEIDEDISVDGVLRGWRPKQALNSKPR